MEQLTEKTEITETIKDFISWKRLKGYAAGGERYEKHHLKMFSAYLGEQNIIRPEGLTRESLQDFQEMLAFKTTKKGCFLKAAYRNQILYQVKLFLRWLKEKDFIAGDPAKEIAYVKEPKKLPRNILSKEEVEKLLELPDMTTCGGFRDRLILELLYATGLRSNELRTLKISDIDLSQRTLHVREGKGGKDRVVPLGVGACQLIGHFLGFVRPRFFKAGEHDYLLPGKKPGPLAKTTFHTRVYAYGKKLGARVHPHGLRHACATHMLTNGAPIRYVQELLGHADISSTQVYTHLTITDLKKAHAKYHPREKALKKAIEKKPLEIDNRKDRKEL